MTSTSAVRLAESAAGREAVCNVNVECRHENKENAMSSNWMAMAALYVPLQLGPVTLEKRHFYYLAFLGIS